MSSVPPSGANQPPQNIPPPSASSETSSNLSQNQWDEQAKGAIANETGLQGQPLAQQLSQFVAENGLDQNDHQHNLALLYISHTKGAEKVQEIMSPSQSNVPLHARIDAVIQSVNETDPHGPQFPLLSRLS